MRVLACSLIVSALALVLQGQPCIAGVAALDAFFRADAPFPNYIQFWDNAKTNSGAAGGFIHVFVRNEGAESVRFEDALLEGISLKEAVAFSDQRKFRKHAFAASIYFSGLSQKQKESLIEAGEPVWYRFEPGELASGQCGELIIRLRSRPPAAGVGVSLAFSGRTSLNVSVTPSTVPPRFEGIAFSPDRGTAFLYVGIPSSGERPAKVFMDGLDITGDSVIHGPAGSLYAIVSSLKAPPPVGSFHCFQVVYSGGARATAALRAYANEFAYGMWGAAPSKGEDNALAKAYLRDLADHSINTVMEQTGSEAVRAYMASDEGRKLMAELGLRRMISDIGKGGDKNPWSYFLMDEPDAGDAKVQGMPGGKLVGSLGQGLVERSQELRGQDPVTPHLLNVDMTYKPQNWYTYAQLPDILTADPYYQIRLAETYSSRPEKKSIYEKADFVAAVAEVCRSAQAPKQTDLVIFTGEVARGDMQSRFATPQEKRIEAYYAVGAGCKGVSYWWFHSLAKGLPPRQADPTAVAQWREIGLVGAELGTLGPVIMTGCPADITVKTASKLWIRTIISGGDTILLVAVNNDYANDDKGTNINPVKDAELLLKTPEGFDAKSVFTVSSSGLSDVNWAEAKKGEIRLRFDVIDVTAAVVITRDSALREKLQRRYDSRYAPRVARLLGGAR